MRERRLGEQERQGEGQVFYNRQQITSAENPLVREAAALKEHKYRKQLGRYLVEGVRAAEEAVASGKAVRLYYRPEALSEPRIARIIERAQEVAQLCVVTEKVMRKVCDTVTPQSIAAECALSALTLKDLATVSKILVLDQVADPGNVGTIIRTADAFGVEAVVLLAGTADCYSPKVVRSTMGSLFHLAVCTEVEVSELLSWAKERAVTVVTSALSEAQDLPQFVWPERAALIVGNEAKGVRQELLSAARARVRIPMTGQAESLNVAVATGILLHAWQGIRGLRVEG